MTHTLAQIIKGTTATLQHLKSGNAYYRIEVPGEPSTFYQFPIDMGDKEDVGEGIFSLEMKASQLMRWLRKAIDKDLVIEWQHGQN